MNADGWPDRFSDSGEPGAWNPWIFWVFLIWGGILVIRASERTSGGPPTEPEIDRKIERLRTR
jgi:hypothetical protein